MLLLYDWPIGHIFVLLHLKFLRFNTRLLFVLWFLPILVCIDVLGILLLTILSIDLNVFGFDSKDGSIMYLILVQYRSNYV